MRNVYRIVAGSFAGFAALAACRSASAAVIPYTQIEQSRAIEVQVSATAPPNDPLSAGARETSETIGSVFRTYNYEVSNTAPPPNQSASAAEGSAQQNVVLGDTAIFGTLSARAHVTHRGGHSSSLASSSFNTRFTVAEDTPFNLEGVISLTSFGLGAVGQFSEGFIFTSTGPEPGQTESFVLVGVSGGNGGGTYPLHASGVLHPDRIYTLSVGLLGQKSTDGGAGAEKLVDGHADFTLTLPEPAGLALWSLAAAAGLARRRRA